MDRWVNRLKTCIDMNMRKRVDGDMEMHLQMGGWMDRQVDGYLSFLPVFFYGQKNQWMMHIEQSYRVH